MNIAVMDLKIAVINFSGNMGKSTIVRHLLAPRMPNAEIFTIESINSDEMENNAQAKRMRGEEFGKLYARLLIVKSAIVDVGASNVEEFDLRMDEYEDSYNVFDMFVLPTLPDAKAQKDTRATIEVLSLKGVGPEKIRVLFNKAPKPAQEPLSQAYSQIFQAHEQDHLFVLDPNVVLYQSGVFAAAAKAGVTVHELAGARDHYKTLIGEATTDSERERLGFLTADASMAVGVNKQMEGVFRALMG